MKLLHVDSSILGEHSVSRRLSAELVEQWRRRVPGLEVTYRDLAAEPLPHFSGALIAARSGAETGMGAGTDPALARDLELSEAVLAEFLAADVVVVGAPMYNFSVSSQLKAWIDRLATQGRTFRYSEQGPVGLAGGKKVIVVSSRGGLYGPDSGQAEADHQEPYLRSVFAFFGIEKIDYLRAEGVALGPDVRDAALAEAARRIAAWDTQARAAA